jgi:hypothetical protein
VLITTSGGAAGEATWLTVTQSDQIRYSDGLTETNGSFTNTNDDQLPRTTQASPAQLDALQQAVASAESQQVNEEYGAGTPDQGTQHVVCGAKGIDVYAGVPTTCGAKHRTATIGNTATPNLAAVTITARTSFQLDLGTCYTQCQL